MKRKEVTYEKMWERVQWWQQELSALGVAHWRMDELTIESSDEAWASVLPNGLYDRFKIWFDPDFLRGSTEQEVDEVVVHELMHVVMRDLDLVTNEAEKFVPGGGQKTASDWLAAVRRSREALVHRLAVYIVSKHYES